MKYVGAHVSISGGVENAPVNAYRIGAKGFALFTKNQRQWVAAPYSAENVERFQQRCQEFGYTAVFSSTAQTLLVLSSVILIDSAIIVRHSSSLTFFNELPG